MPSARSVAFRRDALEAVGGYPEWLAIGEDMWVNHRWRERAFDMRLRARGGRADGARVRRSAAIWTQYVAVRARRRRRPACIPERHALRFAVYGGLAGGARVASHMAEAAGGRRRPSRTRATPVRVPATRAAAAALRPRRCSCPALLAFTDLAKM